MTSYRIDYNLFSKWIEIEKMFKITKMTFMIVKIDFKLFQIKLQALV